MSNISSVFPVVITVVGMLVVIISLVLLWVMGLEKISKRLRLQRQTIILALILFCSIVLASMAVLFSTTGSIGILNVGKILTPNSIFQEKNIKWTLLNNNLLSTSVKDILINKDEPTSIYLNTGDGIFKSTDYGGYWQQFNNGIKEEDKSRLSQLEDFKFLSIMAGSGEKVYQYSEDKWKSSNYFNMLSKLRELWSLKENPDVWNYLDQGDKTKVENALQMLRGINIEDNGKRVMGTPKIIDMAKGDLDKYFLIVVDYLDEAKNIFDKNTFNKEKFSSRVFLIKNPDDRVEMEDLTDQFPVEFSKEYKLQKLFYRGKALGMPQDKLFILYDGKLYDRSVEEKEWHLISNDFIDEKTKITDIEMSHTMPCEIISSNLSSKDRLKRQPCFGRRDLPVMYITTRNHDKDYDAIITNNPYLVENNDKWGVVASEDKRSTKESYFLKELLETESWLIDLMSFEKDAIKFYNSEVIYTSSSGYYNKFVLIDMNDKKMYLFNLPEEVKNRKPNDFLIDPSNKKRFYITVGGVGVYKGEVE